MKNTHIEDYAKVELTSSFYSVNELSENKVTLVDKVNGAEHVLQSSIDDCKRYIVNNKILVECSRISVVENWTQDEIMEMSRFDYICLIIK